MSVSDDIIPASRFFVDGGCESLVRTPDHALLKPIDDEGVEDRNGSPWRFALMEVKDPGSEDSRLPVGKVCLTAIDRGGCTLFLSYDC